MKRLIKFYSRHRGLVTLLAVVVAFAVAFHAPQLAHAAGTDADPGTNELFNNINGIFIFVIKGASMILWPVLLMIGSLLDNDLVFGGAMGERLLGVWVQVRNLVNIVFVLVLLAIALFNVLGRGDELGGLQLGFKQVLPKFVLALIAVNFSFLAIKVVLDFTNVMTGAVFAIPSTMGSSYNIQDEIKTTICGTTSQEVPGKPLWCKGTELSDKAKDFFGKLDRTNIAVAYAIRFGRTPQLKFIRDGLKGVTELAFNILFNAVLFVVYAVSFVALFIVLLFRLVVLWLVVALSPLLALGIVLPNLKELGGGSKLQEKFVKSATAPLVVGFVLSLGYVMLEGFSIDKSIHGSILASNSIDSLDSNAIPTDIGDLQQLMVAIGSIAVVWLGVFSATEGAVGDGIIGSIKEYTGSFGSFMAKLPAYAQVIPTKKGTPTSLMSMVNKPQRAMRDFIEKGSYDHDVEPKSERIGKIDQQVAEGEKQYAKNFVNNLGIYADPEAKTKLMEALKNRDAALYAALRGTSNSPKGIAEAIFKTPNSKYAKEIIDALPSDAKNETALAEKIEAISRAESKSEAAAPTTAPKPNALDDLKNRNNKPDVLAKKDEFKEKFKGWTENEIRTLQQLDDSLITTLLTTDAQTGALQKETWMNAPGALAAVKTLSEGLLNVPDVPAATRLIGDARGAGLPPAVTEKIIKGSTMRQQQLRDDILKANK